MEFHGLAAVELFCGIPCESGIPQDILRFGVLWNSTRNSAVVFGFLDSALIYVDAMTRFHEDSPVVLLAIFYSTAHMFHSHRLCRMSTYPHIIYIFRGC